MDDPGNNPHFFAIEACIERLKQGSLPPWKVEDELVSGFGIEPPENFRIAAQCRRGFLEEVTGEGFRYIELPEKPYKAKWRCPKDDLVWELDARDEYLSCSLCGGQLDPLDGFGPLVSNYVGGQEIYFSYAGRIEVRGDVETTFTNLLVYGTGMGPIGVTRGCHLINRLGGAEVRVADRARAVRCNGYVFKNRELLEKARSLIERRLPQIRAAMEQRLKEFSGRISDVEFKPVAEAGKHILFIDFVAEFENFRGHGDISRAVGAAKSEIEELLRGAGIKFELSVIAQGHDGDLKPSPRNKRGRFASAEIRVPAGEFESLLKVDRGKFLAFVRVDACGAKNLECQFYSGMGGEIIPAVYKATQVNPQSPLVSSFQNIYAEEDKWDVVYRVELPNVEVGIASTREGLISPVGREALRIMGVRTAKEFAASLVAQVLAGEFNLALEISREKLYSS
jgi:hypothetical protein